MKTGIEAVSGGAAELVAQVLMGLATATTVRSSRRGEALEANKLTLSIRAFDSPWHLELSVS